MRWSLRVGEFNGIAVYVHAAFLLLLGWIFFAHWMDGQGLLGALGGALFVALVFLCIVLHEFGHALMARCYGIRTRDITLYPIGGVARLERIPRDPHQELLIAVAGPAVNVVIAAGLYLGTLPWHFGLALHQLNLLDGNPIVELTKVNVWIVGFNLIPAFPMDGGRVLRAFLAGRMEYGRATQAAAAIGQAVAFGFGFVGLLRHDPLLLFIAFFVYMGASQEAATVEAELAFRGVPVRAAMMTRFRALAPGDPLSRAVEQLMGGAQHDFPVVEGGCVVGLLPHARLIEALAARGHDSPVAEAMQPAPPPASPLDSLEEAFQSMGETEASAVPVLEGGELVGLLTLENIGEFLVIHTAFQGKRRKRKSPGSAEVGAEGSARRVPGPWWRSLGQSRAR